MRGISMGSSTQINVFKEIPLVQAGPQRYSNTAITEDFAQITHDWIKFKRLATPHATKMPASAVLPLPTSTLSSLSLILQGAGTPEALIPHHST
jgi:hypothetical protein